MNDGWDGRESVELITNLNGDADEMFWKSMGMRPSQFGVEIVWHIHTNVLATWCCIWHIKWVIVVVALEEYTIKMRKIDSSLSENDYETVACDPKSEGDVYDTILHNRIRISFTILQLWHNCPSLFNVVWPEIMEFILFPPSYLDYLNSLILLKPVVKVQRSKILSKITNHDFTEMNSSDYRVTLSRHK